MKYFSKVNLSIGLIFIILIGCEKKNLLEDMIPEPEPGRLITDENRVTLQHGAAWGVLTELNNGTVCLFYQKPRLVDSANGVNVAIELIQSFDEGKSWSTPTLVEERRSINGEYFDRTPDSGYIVYQTRNLAVGQLSSGRIICAFDLQDYYYDKNGKGVIVDSTFQSIFINRGVAYCYSDDMGISWSKIKYMDLGPISKQSSPHFQIIISPDGAAVSFPKIKTICL